MKFENNAAVGSENRYEVTSVPAGLLAREYAGTFLHFGKDVRHMDRRVTLRTTRYVGQEARGVAGIEAGRKRLLRQITLLNRVDGVVFPEMLDRIDEQNLVDPRDGSLIDSEPVLVYQHLPGRSLEALLLENRRYFLPKTPNDAASLHAVSEYRFANFFRRVVVHLRTLLRAEVAHVDLSPSHVLMSHSDEVPHLLGPGHLVALRDGRIDASDPCLRFTTAGFPAPELVTGPAWGDGASGDGVMAYGVGVLMAQVLLGPTPWLNGLCVTDGELRVRDRIASIPRTRISDLVTRLTAPLAAQRCTLADAEEQLRVIAGELAQALQCERCRESLTGRAHQHIFTYGSSSATRAFTMCVACLRISVAPTTRACSCGGSYVEREGSAWARDKVGEAPRRWCSSCAQSTGPRLRRVRALEEQWSETPERRHVVDDLQKMIALFGYETDGGRQSALWANPVLSPEALGQSGQILDEQFLSWKNRLRAFTPLEVTRGEWVKVGDLGHHFIVRFLTDGTLEERPLYGSSTPWSGQWRLVGNVLRTRVNQYELDIFAQRQGAVHSGVEVVDGAPHVHSYFRVVHAT